MNEELLNYVKAQLSSGTDENEIRQILKKTGWDDNSIDEALNTAKQELNLSNKIEPTPTQQQTQQNFETIQQNQTTTNQANTQTNTETPTEINQNNLTNQTSQQPLTNQQEQKPQAPESTNPQTPQQNQTEDQQLTQSNLSQNQDTPSLLEQAKKNKPKSKLILIIIILILVLLGIAGVFAYFKYFRLTPQKAIQKMVQNIQNVKTYSFNAEIKTNIKLKQQDIDSLKESLGADPNTMLGFPIITEKNILPIKLNYKSLVDIRNKKNPKISSNIELSLNNNILLKVRFKKIDDNLYVKLDNLPSLLQIFLMGDFGKYWLQINTKDEQIKSTFNLTYKDRILSLETIKQAFKNKQVLNITQGSPKTEVIDNIDTYHYILTINKEELKKVISEIIKNSKLKEQEKKLSLNKLETNYKSFNIPPIHLWIGKKDFLPYKLFVNFKLKDYIQNPQYKNKLSDQDTVIITIKINDYNKDITISKPENIKTLEQLLGSTNELNNFVGKQTPELQEKNSEEKMNFNIKQSKIDSDNDGLTDDEERIYGTDINNPDTDGDGYLDGQEVKNGYNPLGPGKLEK